MHLFAAFQKPARFLSVLLSGLLIGALGCSLGTTGQSGPAGAGAVQGVALQGSVHGGQQPVSGSTIQLYQAGTPASGGGYGSGAVGLIPTGSYFAGGAPGCVSSSGPPVVTCYPLPVTDSNGGFSISNEYSCSSANSQVYIVATGGNPGSTGTNSYITLMSALGSCNSTNSSGNPSLSSALDITINEVSTAASVYALQQFMSTPATNTVELIGAPGNTYNGVQTAVVGLTNAFAMVPNLLNISNGTSPGTNSAVVVESSQIYTVANILASCINTVPGPSSTSCSTLMSDATPTGANAATDTLQAAFYIINNPYASASATNGVNYVKTLYNLGTPKAPFPSAGQPTDFTLAVEYAPCANTTSGCPSAVTSGDTEPAIALAAAIAIDAYGNAWLLQDGKTSTNTSGTNISTPSGVVEIGASGTLLYGPQSTYVAQTTKTVGGSSVNIGAYGEFTTPPTSTLLTRTFVPGSYNSSIVVDLSNNVWASDERDANIGTPLLGTIAYLTGSGGANSTPGGNIVGYFVGESPDGIAIGSDNSVYVASGGGTATTAYSSGALDKFIAGSPTSYTFSTTTNTTSPYAFKPSLTQLAIGQYTGVTNSRPTTPVTNDGSLIYAAVNTCTEAGTGTQNGLGALYEFTTNDIVPTAYSALVSSYGASSNTSSLCPTAISPGSYYNALTSELTSMVLDKNDNVWATDWYQSQPNGFNGVSFFQMNNATGSIISNQYGSVSYNTANAASSTTGLSLPFGIAIDGNNNAWVGNDSASDLVVYSAILGDGSTTAPTITQIAEPFGPTATKHFYCNSGSPAIDASGNVWTVNSGLCTTTPGPVTPGFSNGTAVVVLVGIAPPVITPIAEAVVAKMVGQKP